MWAKKFAMTVDPELAVMVYDPGQCETNNDVYHLMKKLMKCCYPLYKKVMGTRKPKDGATVALWCADSPAGAFANGKYIDFGIFGGLKVHPEHDLVSHRHTISTLNPSWICHR